jgi:hypothetical protein
MRWFAHAFNHGVVKAMAATFAVPSSILDGLPSQVWHGPTACELGTEACVIAPVSKKG